MIKTITRLAATSPQKGALHGGVEGGEEREALFISVTSAAPVENVPVQKGPIAWPPVLLHAAFSRAALPDNFTLDTALP